MDDRAQRPAGLLAALSAAFSRWRAEDPEPPQEIRPPKGLAELGPLLIIVSAARGPVLPPIKRDALGTSLLTASEWCARAGLPPAVGVLAVLLASEAEPITSYPQYAWATAEAVINAARAIQNAGESLEDAIVRRAVGKFGDYIAGAGRFSGQGGRWASTAQQPIRCHVSCAGLAYERAVAGQPNILAHGATQWTDNDTQHRIHTAAMKAGDMVKAARNPPPEVVMTRRYASGAKWIGPLADATGEVIIDPWKLSLLGPEGVGQAEASAMLADGRRRWKRPAGLLAALSAAASPRP